MSKFTGHRGTHASGSNDTVSTTTHRLLLGLTVTAVALLLTASAWVVLADGDDVLADKLLPVAADPFVPAPIPAGPTASATATATTATLNPAAGRDPFVPLVRQAVTPAAGSTTPYPTVTTTATPATTPTATPQTTPAPAGKKKQVPTTGPTL